MKKDFLDILRCPLCGKTAFGLEIVERDDIEIRKGKVSCKACNAIYEIDNGILNFLKSMTVEVDRERQAVSTEDYIRDNKGNAYKINKESIEKFKKQFLLLPEGDGSYFFKKGGCFQPIAEASGRFYDTLRNMDIKGKERILCLGDGFGCASYRLAKYGCNVTALDISDYLLVSDLYVKSAYFNRIFSDMHNLPFVDNTFDIVFCSAVLHHSKNLKKVFLEAYRILNRQGRVFIINESARGVLEKVNPLFRDLEKRGYSDTAYTLPQWVTSAESAGFSSIRLELLSLSDDYIVRQENRDRKDTGLLMLAYFFRNHKRLETILSFLLRYPRILFRPKSWRMVCVK